MGIRPAWCTVAWCAVLAPLLCSGAVIVPGDPALRFFGRHTRNATSARFDWIGAGVALTLSPTSGGGPVVVDMDGAGNVFAAFVGGVHVGDIDTAKGAGRRNYAVAANVTAGQQVRLLKSTEDSSAASIVQLHGIILGPGMELAAAPGPSRRIDIYGDSDSAAYGVDGSDEHTLACLSAAHGKQNFAHGWAHTMAEDLRAELHTQAVSGIGVVKNAVGGVACSMGIALPQIVGRSLQFIDANDYNASSWVPDVWVVYVGSNDMVNLFPPSEAAFTKAYQGMLDEILKPFVRESNEAYSRVVHVCNNATGSPPCGWISGVAQKTGGVFSSTFGIGAHGCVGHRNITEQAQLAARLGPVIAAAASW